jgi:hypothetical protein
MLKTQVPILDEAWITRQHFCGFYSEIHDAFLDAH